MVRGEEYQRNNAVQNGIISSEILMIHDDDEESLPLSTIGSSRRSQKSTKGVPPTVMMMDPKCSSSSTPTSACKPKQVQRENSLSSTTCATSCSSSTVSSYSSSRRRNSISSTKSSKKSLSREIIAHLREELAQVKKEAEKELSRARAEADSNFSLVQKLLEENHKIRQEANEAHARADRLEEEVERLSSAKREPLGWRWRGAAQAIRGLQGEAVEEEETVVVEEKDIMVAEKETMAEEKSNDDDFLPSASFTMKDIEPPIYNSTNSVRSCMKKSVENPTTKDKLEMIKSKPTVTIQVPAVKEEEEDNTDTIFSGFRSILQRATSSKNTETEDSLAVISKEVTAEALLWESFAWNSSSDFRFDANDLTSTQRIGASLSVGGGKCSSITE